jgi:RNA polymerase sigma-70 factor (ECF subfamily)
MTTPPPENHDLEATAQLLSMASDGDEAARNQLVARFLPILNRWAHGRLPPYARDLADTADLVQVALLRALHNLDNFESRGEGAFLAYLRQILINAVRDEIRRTMRRPGHGPLFEQLTDRQPSALERAIGRERMDRYETGLERLEERQRQAVLLRFEFGYSHAEVAAAIGAPSANAARMVVARAVLSLSEVLDAETRPDEGC